MFIRTVEDFTCEHCGTAVKGDGYTNHCPSCLWSKHVDTEPGDRGATCGGMMKPVRLEKHKKDFKITHQCQLCGYEKVNKAAVNDNLDILLNTKGII